MYSINNYSFVKINSLEHSIGLGYRIPRFKAPYLLLWFYSFFDIAARQALYLHGHKEKFDTSKVVFSLTFYIWLKIFFFKS